MSFWLDDIAGGDDAPTSQNICPNCTGTTFYDDPITNIPTCASCFTQSQTATQEEFGDEDAYALTGGVFRGSSSVKSGGSKKGVKGRERRPLSEFDRSRGLPTDEDCCEAFEWLLNDSVTYVAKLIKLEDQDGAPTIEAFQQTVKEIWTRYRTQWTDAANAFQKKYPECRFAFRDYFLDNQRKALVYRHLSITVGKRVEEEMIQEMQMKYHDMDDDAFMFASRDDHPERTTTVSDSEELKPPPKKKQRRIILRVHDLVAHTFSRSKPGPYINGSKFGRYPNGIYEQHPYKAVMRINPSLDLILAILQLALTHFKLGVAPYHLTSFVANGSLPHVLNGFRLLTPHLQMRVEIVKDFFIRSSVSRADVIQDLADLLATAIDWYGSDELEDGLRLKISPHECLVNVELLSNRMLQDFAFDKQVSINASVLMGIKSSETTPTGTYIPPRLNYAEKCYTPLHVAAVIVVACKFCPDWETWNIMEICSRTMNKSNASIPWNDSQFQTLQHGHQIDNYLDFLESNAFSAIDAPSRNVCDFFQSLEEDMPSSSNIKKDEVVARTSSKEEEHNDTDTIQSKGGDDRYSSGSDDEDNHVDNDKEHHTPTPDITSSPYQKSEYELLRERNIERNNARLKALGLAIEPSDTSANHKTKQRRRTKAAKVTNKSARRSSRLSGTKINYADESGTEGASIKTKGELPTTLQLLQVVDKMYQDMDADKTSVKAFLRSVASHFGLEVVDKEMKARVKERIAFLNSKGTRPLPLPEYDYVTTYNVQRYKQKKGPHYVEGLRVVVDEASHPQYCQLLEYICYVMEEPDTKKLHGVVADIENELFPAYHLGKQLICQKGGCSSFARKGGYCVAHGGTRRAYQKEYYNKRKERQQVKVEMS